MYDDFLRMDLPAGTSIIGFADDALVVCATDDIRILELRINKSLWRAKSWLDSRGLKTVPEKTEALLVTDRRSYEYLRIVLGEHEVKWKTSIKYQGVKLVRRLSLGEHLQIATVKVIKCGANLAWLMPNIGGPREERQETFQPRKGLNFITDLQEIARTKEVIRKDGRHRLVQTWQKRWHDEQTARSWSSPPG